MIFVLRQQAGDTWGDPAYSIHSGPHGSNSQAEKSAEDAMEDTADSFLVCTVSTLLKRQIEVRRIDTPSISAARKAF